MPPPPRRPHPYGKSWIRHCQMILPDEAFYRSSDGPAEFRLVSCEVPGPDGSGYRHLMAREDKLYDPEYPEHVVPAPPEQGLVTDVLNKTIRVYLRVSCGGERRMFFLKKIVGPRSPLRFKARMILSPAHFLACASEPKGHITSIFHQCRCILYKHVAGFPSGHPSYKQWRACHSELLQ